jgi:carbon storage regulator CsrA
MLVVTRRTNEKITFPSLGITVHILRLTGTAARVGVEAPPDVRVLRDELRPACPTPAGPARRRMDHALANALSKVTLGIHLARKQGALGRAAEAERTLDGALKTLDALAQADAAPPAPAAPRPGRALIVEDDANERELLAGVLGLSGCECATAADGEDALAYLEAGGRPDVILLDMGLPRCDGPETLRRIRGDERFARLRVFSVSGTDPRELNVPVGPNGFDAWFPKPLNPRGLCAAVQAAVLAPPSVN